MISPFYVCISGGIAVGKTTLATELAAVLPSCQTFIEHPENNPYLADFYADMHRWALHSRIAMLAMFASHYKETDQSRQIILLDRSLHELITFANLQADRGNLVGRDLSIYRMLYDAFVTLAPPLDCVVYLTCSPRVAMDRIARRGRVFERQVTESYLLAVEEYYERWLPTLPPATTILRYNTDNGVATLTAESDIRSCLFK
jgi:deoxyadenosine/deoxycytidine kinase